MHTIQRLLLRGFKDLGINPWAQALTFAAVTLVAFLGALFLLVLHNLDQELKRVRGDVVYQVYWRADAPILEVQDQWRKLKGMQYLAELKTFTPDQAMQDLTKRLGKDVDLQWLQGERLLPPTALLSFSPPDAGKEQWREATYKELAGLQNVQEVHINTLGSDLAGSWSRASHRLVWPLITFLALVLALVVGNTIRLSMLSRKEEIDILKLVGARSWYIQLPLLVTGAIQGFVGSVLALIMLKIVQASFANFLNVPPLLVRIRFLPFDQVLLLVFVLTSVALLSGMAAVRGR